MLAYLWVLPQAFFTVSLALYLDRKSGCALTFIFSFYTAALSIGSRALWPHTVALPCIIAVLYFLEKKRLENNQVITSLALPLAFTFMVRPTNAIFVASASLYVLYQFHLRRSLPFLCAGLLMALAFGAYNLSLYDTVLPLYFMPNRIGHLTTFWNAFFANAISPSRGLFIFNPLFLVIMVDGIWRMFKRHIYPMEWMSWATIIGLYIANSSFPHWWAGHSYGPRFFTDAIPLFLFLGICSLRNSPWVLRSRWQKCLVAICVIWGLFIHVNGAINGNANEWNAMPQDVNDHPERIWDFNDPQFLS